MTGSLSADLLRVLHDAEKEAPSCLRRSPQAAFVLKLRDISYRKLFVNVCILEEYDQVVAALRLEREDARFALSSSSLSSASSLSSSSLSVPLLLSKVATPSTDKRDQPCVVFQCGCDRRVIDRIQDGDSALYEALTARLVEALEGRGWELAPGLGSVVRPKMKNKCKDDIPEVLRWGFPVNVVAEATAEAAEVAEVMIRPEHHVGKEETRDVKPEVRITDSVEDSMEPLLVATKTVRYTPEVGVQAESKAASGARKETLPKKGLRRGFLL